MRIKTLVALAALSIALVTTTVALASGSGSRTSGKSAASVTVTSRSVTGLGKILVNSKGQTLYMFAPDKRQRVTCFAVCAKIWPPLKLPAGAKVAAAGGVKASLLKSDADKQGFRVVTYNGWPLYTYLGDRKPGVASGQALNLNGGLWYVLSTSGAIIKTKPGSGGGGGGGGGGGSTNPKTTTTSPTSTNGCSDDDGDGDTSAGGPDDGDGCI